MTSDPTPTPTPAAPDPAAAWASERQKLDEQLQALGQERARAQDQLQRTLADMQNLRRHTQRQLDEGRQNTLSTLVGEFLPVLDNLERAARLSKSPEELQSGLKLVLALFTGILDRHGVARIPAAGVPFDPRVHEAVAAETRSDLAAGTVIEEVEPGYRIDQKVIRTARVKVSKADPASAAAGG